MIYQVSDPVLSFDKYHLIYKNELLILIGWEPIIYKLQNLHKQGDHTDFFTKPKEQAELFMETDIKPRYWVLWLISQDECENFRCHGQVSISKYDKEMEPRHIQYPFWLSEHQNIREVIDGQMSEDLEGLLRDIVKS